MVRKEFFGEGKNIEFKREIPNNHEKFLKDIIAFSNSTGGQVILGIEDETCTVYGIGEQSPFKLSDAISNSSLYTSTLAHRHFHLSGTQNLLLWHSRKVHKM